MARPKSAVVFSLARWFSNAAADEESRKQDNLDSMFADAGRYLREYGYALMEKERKEQNG